MEPLLNDEDTIHRPAGCSQLAETEMLIQAGSGLIVGSGVWQMQYSTWRPTVQLRLFFFGDDAKNHSAKANKVR